MIDRRIVNGRGKKQANLTGCSRDSVAFQFCSQMHVSPQVSVTQAKPNKQVDNTLSTGQSKKDLEY